MSDNISVIIPFYNSIKTLPALLDSILNGDLVPSEVILVDDGSTDASKDLVLEYAKKHSCIKYLSQKHSGVSAARNLGLSNANGTWISFLDADDFIEPDMYSTMLEAVTDNTGVEGCICGYFTHKEGIVTPYSFSSSEILSSKDILKAMFTDDSVRGFLFTRLFRSDLLKDVSFNQGVFLCEDLLFQTQLFSAKDVTFAVVKKPLYHYVQSPESITGKTSFFSNNTFSYKPAYDLISQYIQDDYVKYSYNEILNFSMYTLIKSYRQDHDKKTLAQIRLLQKEMRQESLSFQRKSRRRLIYETAPVLFSHFIS